MGYTGAKNLKQISKNAKFIKLKAGFYSMVHSVEMTQKTINCQIMITKFLKIVLIMICIPNHLLANTFTFRKA